MVPAAHQSLAGRLAAALPEQTGADGPGHCDPVRPDGYFRTGAGALWSSEVGLMFAWPGWNRPGHFHGLDSNARDIFSRLMYGARVSVVWGLFATSSSF